MSTKLKCLLLDDELPGLTYLKMLCEQIPALEVVKAFNSPRLLQAELPGLDFDLCITDIEMPGINGLELAALLKGKPVIFTTAYNDYAAEAFDVDAIDYIRKPVTKERLQQAVYKVKKHLATHKKVAQTIQLNTDKGKAILAIAQLCYIKTSGIDSRDKTVQLADGTSLTLKNVSFEKLNQILPKKDFIRINKKEMIAVNTVQLFSFNEVITNIPTAAGSPLKLMLSEVYRREFLEKVNV